MKAVILAAGDGGRLRPLTLDTPKVVLEIGGRPLISYSLDALAAAGVSEIAVVTGYQAHKVRDALAHTYPNLTFIHNEHHDGGNALSVYAARRFVMNSPFIVCMGDHPISSQFAAEVVSYRQEGPVLCVDLAAWHPSQTSDATRVVVGPNGYVETIGKRLKVWNAIDTGVFQMTWDVFPVIEDLMRTRGLEVTITDVVRSLGAHGRPFATCDVTGMFWADVDTLEDYQGIDILLGEMYGERI